ncbi:DUF6471 domain-containing protein [Legionella longbeachae]|uniref:DUF6471 domain-containing protein n=1 Tax=Legionella longbeachae TaxID=450 RepID=UPI001404858F|nr:DUF6471 domain-containing protein [Legionella longbeachae]QIN32729.1 hypothetical protein GCB94_11545 [Legionella longbeachae]
MKDWNKLASGLLKAELKRRDIGYEKLIALLEQVGIQETRASILNKMSRGTFQFSFFLQCATAIGMKNLRLDDLISELE